MDSEEKEKFEILYQKHLRALKLQGKSETTIDLYSRPVRRIADFFGRCPDDLTTEDLKRFFEDLVQKRSWSTVKTDRYGLQFFWRHVLDKPWEWGRIVKPPQFKTLPDVLTVDETGRVLNAVRMLRYRVCLFTIYSMGLRLGEGLNLRIADIDSRMMQVHIRNGKGRKDRLLTLPQATLEALRAYWKTHQNPKMLFPSCVGSPQTVRTATNPMDRGGLQEALKGALRDVGITKRISVHSLRHSFATHLVEAGVQLRLIQEILGHSNPQTTVIYTRLTEPSLQNQSRAINALMARIRFSVV